MDDYSNIFPIGRRDLLKWAGMTVAGSLVSAVPRLEVYAQGRSQPASTARNAIMIEMSGAISPMDCWDLKETKMTPKDLDPQRIWNDFYLSKTLFPKLIDTGLINRCSFVRSMLGRELIHLTGQYPCPDRPLDQPGGRERDSRVRQCHCLRARVTAPRDGHLPDLHEHEPVA